MASQQVTYTPKLANSYILVLGGTSGIGFAIASLALSQGAHVTISSSQPTNITTTISRLQTSFPTLASNLRGHACDLSSPDTLESNIVTLLKLTASEGTIDHIVVTAGDSMAQIPWEELTIEKIQQRGMVRFNAPMMLAKHAPAYFSPGPKSSITFTSGTLVAKPMPGSTVSIAYGGGVETLMRGLAVDLAPTRVNVISPGAVLTELFTKRFGEGQVKGMMDLFAAQTLVGRVGTPEELAEAYAFVMGCEFITGQVLQVDGGRLLK